LKFLAWFGELHRSLVRVSVEDVDEFLAMKGSARVWKMIRDLVGSDPALNSAAWETLRGTVGMLPSGEAGAGSAARPESLTEIPIMNWAQHGSTSQQTLVSIG
jgi:hypothetical protein